MIRFNKASGSLFPLGEADGGLGFVDVFLAFNLCLNECRFCFSEVFFRFRADLVHHFSNSIH